MSLSFCVVKRTEFHIFGETMPRNKFTKLLKYLRFDDKPNRIRSAMGKAKPTGLKSIKPHDDFDQIALNYVVCIYFASPGASHLLNCVIR